MRQQLSYPTGRSASNVGSEKKSIPMGRKLRWSFAIVITFAAVIVAVTSYWYTPLRICRDVINPAAGQAPRSCSPWTSLDLLPALIPSLFLVFPELGELTVMNVFSLKRKAEEQQAEINDTVQRQNDLEFRFLAQVANMNATQTVTQHFYPASDAANLSEQVDDEESAEPLEFAEEPFGGYLFGWAADDSVDSDLPSTRSAVQLLHEWDKIDIRSNPGREIYSRFLSSAERKKIDDFRLRHRNTIDTIRLIRNSIAHGRSVPKDDLNGALEAAVKLNRILDDFGIPPF
ncbi:hypothetical protein [Amycolatopsis thermophila]|uniref:Swt1-like HEPN domain-containing protein n=1 Tax=Amycolatopsis thermophila TaxID=206084 RepID=A0ABU0EUV0_9PSEU|nr:hypothetical protein [Amycolatopsis thermophila]MDQ0379062.1 hypothetical protein [Amycolatopsis thermophila]